MSLAPAMSRRTSVEEHEAREGRARWLRGELSRADMSHFQLAKRLGLESPRRISRWMNCDRSIPAAQWDKLQAVFA